MADGDAIDPVEAGRRAAERNEPITSNPYPPGSDAARRWQAGHASFLRPDDVADDLADFA